MATRPPTDSSSYYLHRLADAMVRVVLVVPPLLDAPRLRSKDRVVTFNRLLDIFTTGLDD